jgi:magnesium chelatase family protein
MLIKTFGSALFGIEARTITVEVDVCQGVNFYMVGLPDNAVRESHHRIDAALKHHGYRIPGRRIVVNLAPADIRKQGSAYDLAIAIGILAATGQMDAARVGRYLLMGELSLDGGLQPIRGALPIAVKAEEEGFDGLILPAGNAREAAVVGGLDVYGVRSIGEVIAFFNGEGRLTTEQLDLRQAFSEGCANGGMDFSEVKGQEGIKRAFEVAAAGGHNLLMIGAPGAGKTMLAKRLPGILPPPSLREALETTKIHSVAGKLDPGSSLLRARPFRHPHHTISHAALSGGGTNPFPGEISLAHNGVLFLDELPEFQRSALEILRQPLEDRVVTLSRSRYSVRFPAAFMLVASMNPCPCGFYNHPGKECVCPPGMVGRYLNRVSGPLLDRIDIQVEVTPVPFNELDQLRPAEGSDVIRKRVMRARARQFARFEHESGVHCNAQMGSRLLRKTCQLDKAGQLLLKTAMERLELSARAYGRILKVSRTVADLGDSRHIRPEHLAEAIQYRSLDRETWGR